MSTATTPAFTSKQFARTYLLAMELHGTSYDVDSQTYKVPIEEACQKACTASGLPDVMWYPLFVCVLHGWNDVQEWAGLVIAEKPISSMFVQFDRSKKEKP